MIVLAFIVLHISCAAAIAFFFFWRKELDWQHLATLGLILFFPVGGLLIYSLLNHGQVEPSDEPKGSEDPDSADLPVFELIEPLNIAAETNIASLEETLLIADYRTRREVILNLLKENESDRFSYIDLALKNEDSETAHYAASGILHTKRKLDTSLNMFSELYRNNPDDMTVAYTYADLLRQYLTTVRLDPANHLAYTYENIRVLERIMQASQRARIVQLTRLIDLLLEIEHFSKTQRYCQDLLDNYPDSEEKYLALLKSYFLMKDKANFEKVFTRFRNANIYFDSETMKVIRLWLGSISHMSQSARTGN